MDKYKNEPKFKSIEDLIKENTSLDPFNKFILLRTKLFHWDNVKNGNSFDLKKQVNYIIKYCCEIIGGEVEGYFSINYKGKIKPSCDEIFIFDKYSNFTNKSKFNFEEENKLEKSVTLKMFEGINEDGNPHMPLSNFEIYKKDKDSSLKYRNATTFGIDEIFSVSNSTECTFTNINDEYNFLFIRISEFIQNPNHSEEDLSNSEKILNTQAVLTFYIKKGVRVAEKKLRLLLLLRKPISDFIKHQLSESHLQEYINIKKQDEYRRILSHRVDKYIGKQMDAFNAQKMIEVAILNSAIAGQTNAYNIDENNLLEIKKEDFKKRLKTMLESDYLPYSSKKINNTILINNDIVIDSFIYDIVIPEVIFNIRRHSLEKNGSTEIKLVNSNLILINKISDNKNHKLGNGSQMCKQIFDLINKEKNENDWREINYDSNFKSGDYNYFKVTIKLF